MRTYSIQQASELAGVSKRTIYNWINDGYAVRAQTPGGLRITAESLETCLTVVKRRQPKAKALAAANAAFVVSACNSHAELLLAALKRIIVADECKSVAMIVDAMPAARAAVAKVEGR